MKFSFKYNIGDRVVCVNTASLGAGVIKGETGVVVNIRSDKCSVGVCWDVEAGWRHTCDGHCPPKHGWYVRPELIALN